MDNYLEYIRSLVDEKHIEYKAAVASYKKEEELLTAARVRLIDTEQARDLIQNVAQAIQQEAHQQIASVVTKGLQTIFDDPYLFKINFLKKRGRTEAVLMFERDGEEIDPLTSSGGGVIDVAAFTLRVACLALSRPAIRPLLILDEPFKNISKKKGYLERVPEYLAGLIEEMGFQMVMVTHIDELRTGEILEIEDTT